MSKGSKNRTANRIRAAANHAGIRWASEYTVARLREIERENEAKDKASQ